MPLIILLIVGVLCLVVSGMWFGSIATDISDGRETTKSQFFWAIFGFLFGLYAIIACIGHIAGVK